MATKFITVSIEIMRDKNLSANQKFILAEIGQLSTLDKGCFASNYHFSELTGITNSGVSKALKKLEKMGYIKINNSKSKRNFGRQITIDSGHIAIDSGHIAIDSGHIAIDSGQESKGNKTINKTTTSKSDDVEVSFYRLNKEIIEKFLNSISSKKEVDNKVAYKSKIRNLFLQKDNDQIIEQFNDWKVEANLLRLYIFIGSSVTIDDVKTEITEIVYEDNKYTIRTEDSRALGFNTPLELDIYAREVNSYIEES